MNNLFQRIINQLKYDNEKNEKIERIFNMKNTCFVRITIQKIRINQVFCYSLTFSDDDSANMIFWHTSEIQHNFLMVKILTLAINKIIMHFNGWVD